MHITAETVYTDMNLLRHVLLALLLTAPAMAAFAQDVQWASTVLEASSERGYQQFSAERAVGRPDVSPGTGENPNAWMPFRDDRDEYIKVGFERPMRIRQIVIAETLNPGAIFQVFIYDRSDNEFLVNTFVPRAVDLPSRMQYIFMDLTEFEVAAVKIVLRGEAVPGNSAIDAIGISESAYPVQQEIFITDSNIVNAQTTRLSENVNSVYNEFRPLIMPDGKTLIFSRQYHPENVGGVEDPEDIWYSEWDEQLGDWKAAMNMGAPLNTAGPNFIDAITPDGAGVIVTLGNQYTRDGKMRAGVSYSRRTSEGWTTPEPIDIINHINFNNKANYYMANNRKVLLMSIESDPTFGDRDLYVSFLRNDGRWSQPLNLGADVNTPMEEASPFLAPDDKTLYFSSKGRLGYGGSDIYVTRRMDDTWTKWSEPENLGPGINTDADETFFNLPPTGEYGYLSRSMSENNSDVFRFEVPKEQQPEAVIAVKGKVYNRKTGEPVEARIFYETLPEGKEIGITLSDPVTGAYEILLPTGSLYGYLAEAQGFISINANIDLKTVSAYDEVVQDLYLVPIERGAAIRLNNVFFDFDKYVLKEESYPELNRVINFLRDYADLRILIGGHTDNIGTHEYNMGLSQRRAEAVLNYLVQGGIEKNRLEAVGYGKTKPIVSNDDEEDGRELNRRVEFKILE
jgi:OmpA-OmpF porin, OOP family